MKIPKRHPLGPIRHFCGNCEESRHLAGTYGDYLDALPLDQVGGLVEFYCVDMAEHSPLVAYLAIHYFHSVALISANPKYQPQPEALNENPAA